MAKCGDFWKGRKHKPETIQKLKACTHKPNQGFQKGHINYNSKETNKIGALKRTGSGNGNYGKKFSDDHKHKLSLAKKGKPWPGTHFTWKGQCLSEEHKAHLRGRKISEKTRAKLSGANKPNWKGGISKIDKRCRIIKEYIQWRSDIFKRDNWTCKICNTNKCYVTAHHIKSFTKIIKEYNIKTLDEARNCGELWDINNGITLCEKCHSLTDNYKGRAKQ